MGSVRHPTAISSHRSGLGRARSLLGAQRDERLVAQLRDGNERAFDALFDRYRARLLAFCRGMLRSSEDAEDVLQEVFVAAHEAILADARTIQIRPWLYRIARNRCLNHLRRPQPEGQGSLDHHPHQHGATTEDKAAGRQDLRDLVESIRQLPESQRSALLLRELEALPYDQIAISLETTVPAVKSLLVRARMSLAEASHARDLSCADVRFELATAAEGIARVPGAARRHIRGCPECRRYRAHLRTTSRGLAALAPIAPLLLLKRLIATKVGGASGGGGALAAGGVGLAGSKAVAGLTVAALVGAGGAASVAAPTIPSPATVVSGIVGGQERAGTIAASPTSGSGAAQGRTEMPPVGAEETQRPGDGRLDQQSEDEAGAGDTAAAETEAEDDGPASGDRAAQRRARLLARFQGDRRAARRWWQRTAAQRREPAADTGGADAGTAPSPAPARPRPRRQDPAPPPAHPRPTRPAQPRPSPQRSPHPRPRPEASQPPPHRGAAADSPGEG